MSQRGAHGRDVENAIKPHDEGSDILNATIGWALKDIVNMQMPRWNSKGVQVRSQVSHRIPPQELLQLRRKRSYSFLHQLGWDAMIRAAAGRLVALSAICRRISKPGSPVSFAG